MSNLLNIALLVLPFNYLRIGILRLSGVKIGKKTWISAGIQIDFPWRLTIGDNCYISRNTYLDCRGGEIRIGDNTDISAGASIYTLSHDIQSVDFRIKKRDVVIGSRVWIGARSIILPGAKISNGTVIGALTCCSIVTCENGLYSGVPAKFIKKLEADRSTRVRESKNEAE